MPAFSYWKPHSSILCKQRKITFVALPHAHSRGSRWNVIEPQTHCSSKNAARERTPCARAAVLDEGACPILPHCALSSPPRIRNIYQHDNATLRSMPCSVCAAPKRSALVHPAALGGHCGDQFRSASSRVGWRLLLLLREKSNLQFPKKKP